MATSEPLPQRPTRKSRRLRGQEPQQATLEKVVGSVTTPPFGGLSVGTTPQQTNKTHNIHIIESVDSICRDGADTPISLNKSNGSELPNADVLSPFRQTTCSESASIHFNTLKVLKIYSYSESRKFVKTRIVHHLLLLLLLLSNSVQTAYRETGVSNRSNSFTKIIYTGAYMILDAQNLHTFSQSRQTPGLQPYKC